MNIELTETDVIFIYGHFQKQLAEFEKIANASNCPFDYSTIENQKAPYLSVIEKLSSQVPVCQKWTNAFNLMPLVLRGHFSIVGFPAL